MEENKKKRYITQAINDEILSKLSLKNRYQFLNTNLMTVLEPPEFNFLKKAQKFCMRFEKKNDITHGPEEDVYEWIPKFGAEGFLTRAHPFEMIDLNYAEYGVTIEFMRSLALNFFDPQFNMAQGATVLAVNPIHEHHENIPIRLEILKKFVTGETPGAILITEPERGSDAVHMLTTCDEQDDGSFLLNGEKIYNTNAPKAGYVVAYATAEQNNGNTMAQFLIDTSWNGWKCERVYIPYVPKVWLGKETFTNLRVPKEYVLGGVGKGREHLFEGLVPERIGIAIDCISQCWNAITHASIYANNRRQFNQEILKFQGVGFLLTDLWARLMNVTLGILMFSKSYDSKVEKFGGTLPKNISQAMVASASQFKYHAAKLSAEICYESANLMGGAGVCDNTLMQDLLNISRIAEIIGGSRQIQTYVLSMAMRQLYKMSGI
ncbi:MAG: acyl-CoA/acyl-ACP dehydrogenase [Candidatus Lokiarchaeota archaeon]|nr:acyl-CoA/acyl-ACP dehydrogenase [Candidatus Lokiarchaeota archaeon]